MSPPDPVAVATALARAFPRTRLGNPSDAIDDLIFILLSNKTAPSVASRVFRELKASYPDWGLLLEARPEDVERILRPAGLQRIRRQHLVGMVDRIHRDFGQLSLDGLRDLTVERGIAYLVSLPGVSEKVARCVLLFCLDADVLPVDAHVHRMALRLGWTTRRRADQCHQELEGIVPPHVRSTIHVGAIQLGREFCRPQRPACGPCPLLPLCPAGRKAGG